MNKIYTDPIAELIVLQGDVLTLSEEWTPGENETERAYSTDSYGNYPNY